jgi:predicted dehydrogenase
MSQITLGVVGLGRIARSHIDGIRQSPDRCELGAVVDIQPEPSGAEVLTQLSIIEAAKRSAEDDRIVEL